jgi:hypothetical protein
MPKAAMRTSTQPEPPALDGDELFALHERSFVDWSESEYGFFVNQWYDATARNGKGAWVENTYAPIRWPENQRRVLRWAFTLNDEGRLPLSELWWVDIGKSAKSLIAAALGQWFGQFISTDSELPFFANSREHAGGRSFKALTESLSWNPIGRELADWDTNKAVFKWTGNKALAAPTSPGSISGGNNVFRAMDEIWNYDDPMHDTLMGEAKGSPTRNISFLFITSYPPFVEDGGVLNKTLEEFFEDGAPRKGIEKVPGLEDLPLWVNANGAGVWWNHQEYPWHLMRFDNGQTFIEREMNRTGVSKAQALRIWKAELVQREDTFMPMDQWDACEDAEWHPLAPNDRKVPVVAAVDIGIYGDHCGGIAVDWDSVLQGCRLRTHKHTRPDDYKGRDRRDAISDMKEWVWRLHQEQNLLACAYDPRDFQQAASELEKLGVKMVEFTQNTMRVESDTLFRNLILGRKLKNYPHARDIREHVMNANAREIGSGDAMRLVKPKSNRRIDLAVAYSMAAWTAWSKRDTFERLAKRGNRPEMPMKKPTAQRISEMLFGR